METFRTAKRVITDIRHEEEEEEDDEEDEEEDEEVRWCHPTKQVRVCQYRSILSIVWWGEIILIIDVFWDGESRGGRSKGTRNNKKKKKGRLNWNGIKSIGVAVEEISLDYNN